MEMEQDQQAAAQEQEEVWVAAEAAAEWEVIDRVQDQADSAYALTQTVAQKYLTESVYHVIA